MQICPKCKNGICFIATSYDNAVVCDYEPITVYTERGRRIEGYVPHKCEVENGGKEKNGHDNG